MNNDARSVNDREWRADAVGRIQSLIVRIDERWDRLESEQRQLAAGAALSLWRAASLIEETDRTLTETDEAARKLLQTIAASAKVKRASEDQLFRKWSAGYYINNAAAGLMELLHRPRPFEQSQSLREAWTTTCDGLAEFVTWAANPHDATTVQMKNPLRT